MSDPKNPHDPICHALDVLTEAGFVVRYVRDSNVGYAIEWSPEGREYCAAIRDLMGMLPIEKPNELLWSSVSFLATIEGKDSRREE